MEDKNGMSSVLAQLNRKNNKEASDIFYREAYLKDLEQYINNLRSKNIEILLCHDANKHLHHQRMQEFYENTSLIDMYQNYNNIENDKLKGTFITGKRHIDHICSTKHVYNAVISA